VSSSRITVTWTVPGPRQLEGKGLELIDRVFSRLGGSAEPAVKGTIGGVGADLGGTVTVARVPKVFGVPRGVREKGRFAPRKPMGARPWWCGLGGDLGGEPAQEQYPVLG
jgi:hypothetical protein